MPRVTLTIPGHPPQPYRFDLDRRQVSFGRDPENDIVVDSPSISTRHAEMLRVGNGYELRDLHSTNGTKLDGERHLSIPLVPGTIAQLGDVDFEFQLSDEELAALSPELRTLPKMAEPAPVGVAIYEEEYEAPQGMSFTTKLVVFLILVLAVLMGLSLRHQKETGRTLLDEWTKPPAPAEPASYFPQ